MTPVRLEPAAPRSRVKNSTTEPLHSHLFCVCVGTFLCHLMIYIKLAIAIFFYFNKTTITSTTFFSARTDRRAPKEIPMVSSMPTRDGPGGIITIGDPSLATVIRSTSDQERVVNIRIKTLRTQLTRTNSSPGRISSIGDSSSRNQIQPWPSQSSDSK